MAIVNELIDCRGVVYMITNNINSKKYIGITKNSFTERYPHGFKNHHNPHLKKSVAKYGIENFSVTILEKNINDINTLQELEIMYIKKYDVCNKDKGYNKSLGGFGVRQTERTKEHCLHISQAKKSIGLNTLSVMSDETLKEWKRRHSECVKGDKNPRYGMTKDKLKPETLEKLRQASMGTNNSMYGKRIKDHMTAEAYASWLKKQTENKVGSHNPKARPIVVIYKNEKYDFGCIKDGIEYFKNIGEFISKYWLYKGINQAYRDKFQYFGYKKEYYQSSQVLA